MGGNLTIAVAEAFSDSLGIHISEEAEMRHTSREIWESTASTFLTKFLFALTFLIPVLLLPLTLAVIVSIVWGLLTLMVFSHHIAVKNGERPFKVVLEHIIAAVVVIGATHHLGEFIALHFS